ncbi:nif-specific transcriptional activator NifA [Vibrio sp. 10N.286.49.B3]|uniref:nif-specific transcriptional activator NifA n=1 Tax=Vibrio sp. 10N.286.49.B3 TaxID=1880855 RepID=UPI000C826ECF|nr:nif-specific transcriptional activator NifA [Vibrio sp. 10N.286.49.B3]PMH44869.1 nif-specific transcriptional activator NifA [Vibrio sp. 10N.286.49.B3]
MMIENSIVELERRLLSAMYRISSQLNFSLNYTESSKLVLEVLHEECGLLCGLLTIKDPSRETMLVKSLHSPDYDDVNFDKQVSYRSGEGIIGELLQQGDAIVIRNLGDDLRFADKLAIYDYDKPFICVPLKNAQSDIIGTLSAQPKYKSDQMITLLSHFLEMVANLISKNVQLSHQVENKQQQLVNERDNLKRKVRNEYCFNNLIGHSEVMRKIFDQIRLVSPWDSTVLLRGESGTGKEVLANAIHYNSPRAGSPFVKLNCAALPDNLLESELFGHEKGAFTGAVKQRKGRFEMADKGTIFLDEIGETSPAFQAKLLRVLQEQEFERVGGTSTISVDVRVIAATNRNLETEVATEQFREDLYYRLNVMPMYLPALRERTEDIPELSEFMLEKIGKKQQRKITIADSTLRHLMSYSWPGNVRELENTLERASIMCESGLITPEHISFPQSITSPTPTPTLMGSPSSPPLLNNTTKEQKSADEKQTVIDALEQSGWVKAKAARLLNMTPRQIAYRIQIMDIEVKKI